MCIPVILNTVISYLFFAPPLKNEIWWKTVMLNDCLNLLFLVCMLSWTYLLAFFDLISVFDLPIRPQFVLFSPSYRCFLCIIDISHLSHLIHFFPITFFTIRHQVPLHVSASTYLPPSGSQFQLLQFLVCSLNNQAFAPTSPFLGKLVDKKVNDSFILFRTKITLL